MKKIFTILALAALSASAFAQKTQQYVRVEFTVPMTSFDDPASGKTGTAVSQGMKDDFTYVNPQHQYLDFNVSEHPLQYRPQNWTNITENTYYYLHQVRNTQTYVADSAYNMPFDVENVKSITPYSIPVETVKLMNTDTVPTLIKYIGNGKTYGVSKFTFNRLPRNVAELKTLIEPNGDGVRTHCHNPAFVAAAMYLVWPRLLDCSQDCRDMVDYLHGKFEKIQVDDTYGIANKGFQDLCISTFAGNQGKDSYNGEWDHNHLFQYFEGATPGNKYMPNGDASKGYFGQDSYTVYVAIPHVDQMVSTEEQNPLEPKIMPSGQRNCSVAEFDLISNPYATTKDDIAFDDPTAKSIEVRSTRKHGWYFHSKPEIYYGKGKVQKK